MHNNFDRLKQIQAGRFILSGQEDLHVAFSVQGSHEVTLVDESLLNIASSNTLLRKVRYTAEAGRIWERDQILFE